MPDVIYNEFDNTAHRVAVATGGPVFPVAIGSGFTGPTGRNAYRRRRGTERTLFCPAPNQLTAFPAKLDNTANWQQKAPDRA